jgi:hypothetical protein
MYRLSGKALEHEKIIRNVDNFLTDIDYLIYIIFDYLNLYLFKHE